MIKSMTGYGREQILLNGREIIVEIRSVNHRYYEFSSRIPRAYGYLEEKLKSFLNGKVSRGKVEVSVSIYNVETATEEIEVNKLVAMGYINALRKFNEEVGLRDDLSLTQLFRMPEAFTVKKTEEDEDKIWEDVKTVAESALSKFISMRETEGLKLKEDVLEKLETIEGVVNKIEERSPDVTAAYRDKLYNKLCEILGNTNIDEQRILTEAAIFSEKTAVDEETVRLHSHISQFRELLNSAEPIGKKLDFIVQEMNREANTTGSKCNDLTITRMVVDLKSDIEKIREQIQNIE